MEKSEILDALIALHKLWKAQGYYTKGLCPGDGRHARPGFDCPACDAFDVIRRATDVDYDDYECCY